MKRPDQIASLHVRLDGRAQVPLYQQIFDDVRGRIVRGELTRGERLPSSRQLASELGVARTTVLEAFDQLAAEGYILAQRASSTRVAPELPDDLGLDPAAAAPRRPGRPPRLSRAARALRALPGGAPRLGDAPRAFRPGAPALDL